MSELVKVNETRLPKFVEDAYESIEKMEGFAKILLDSKLAPNHFYEQTPDRKPDYTKGKVASVVVVLIQAYQLGIPPMTAIQHIIPVNGLLSIKGDLAKSLIFNSGKLKSGTWVEKESGSIQNENYRVEITATRNDNNQTLTRSFSIDDAKRAGLWVTELMTQGQDGYKYKASAWWKYPARMVNYRALGFIARDLFPDVMAGIYTTEEAIDMPVDQTLIIDQGNGATLQIPDKSFAEERAVKMTSRAVEKIAPKEFPPVEDTKPVSHRTPGPFGGGIASTDKDEAPFMADKGSISYFDGKKLESEDTVEVPKDTSVIKKLEGRMTLAEMEEMPTEKLLEMVNTNMDMIDAMMAIPGKNTNKKLREIIWAWQEGTLDFHVAKYVLPEETKGPEVEPNKEFDEQKETELIKPEPGELNRYGLAIPPFNKGNERDFGAMKELFNALLNINPKIDNERFLALMRTVEKPMPAFKNKEEFCKYATIEQVCILLDENYISL